METKIKINGMHCGACKRLIEKRIKTIAGVGNVTVTSETGEAHITADRTITDEEIRTVLSGTEYTLA